MDSAGKLAVGDGNGPLSVDGTVASRPAAPVLPGRASKDIQSGGTWIAGPSSSPINVTSLSISTDGSGNSVYVYLNAYHVPSSATGCSFTNFDDTIWFIRDIGDGVTPVSFSFPTPLQWKPPANTKACLRAEASTAASTAASTTMNAVGLYGG